MPKLSVVCITYNHERYIRQCLDGFVMQKTDFEFEILVHDDASCDGTAAIIREYERKYPGVFRCVYEKERQWGKKDILRDIMFPLVRGEYVALCEGDDYWTDPLKLQKQADFLDRNPKCSICFHPVLVMWENGEYADSVFPDEKLLAKVGHLNFPALLKRNFIQTNSVVYRWRFKNESLSMIPRRIMPGDWFLHLLHAQCGEIGFLPEVMGVYRKHPGGVWNGAGKNPDWFCRMVLPCIRFYQEKERTFGISETKNIKKMIWTAFFAAVLNGDDVLREMLKEMFPELEQPWKRRWKNILDYAVLTFRSKLAGKAVRECLAAKRHALKLYLWKWNAAGTGENRKNALENKTEQPPQGM